MVQTQETTVQSIGARGAGLPKLDVLDAAVLVELASAVGRDYVPTLLRAFADDLARLQKDAANAVVEGNVSRFVATMHSIRGVSASLGARDLAALATEPRFNGRKTMIDLPHAWAELEPMLDAVLDAIASPPFREIS